MCARHKSVSYLHGSGMEWWGWARRCDIFVMRGLHAAPHRQSVWGAVHVCLQCHCICHMLHLKGPPFHRTQLAFLQRCPATDSLSEPCETSIRLPAADLRSMKACGRRSASKHPCSDLSKCYCGPAASAGPSDWQGPRALVPGRRLVEEHCGLPDRPRELLGAAHMQQINPRVLLGAAHVCANQTVPM